MADITYLGKSPHQRWEYFVFKIDVRGWFGPDVRAELLAHEFDKLGAEGWELVNTVDVNRGSGSTSELLSIFKRPLLDPK